MAEGDIHVEAHLRTALRSSFFRNVMGTYATQVLMAVLSLLSSIVIARSLGPDGRGDYAVSMALGLIGVQIVNLGLHATNSYLLAKDRSLLARLLANSLLTSLLLGGAVGAIAGTGLQIWPDAPVHGRLLWLAALWIPFGLAYLLSVNFFVGLLEVRLYNSIELLNKTLAAAFIAIVAWLQRASPSVMFAAVLLAMLISLSFAWRKLRSFCIARVEPSKELFWKNFQLGWKAYLCCLFAFLVIRIDLLMVKRLLGAVAAGQYSIAGTLADYVFLLPTVVSTMLFPKLSGIAQDHEKWKLTLKAMGGIGIGLVAILLVLGVAARPVVNLLFGSAYAPAAEAFVFLLPGILFLGIETVLVQYLNSCGFPSAVVILWISCTVLNIVLNLWMIPRYGINGASMVSSISYLFALLGVLWICYINRNSLPSAERQMIAVTGSSRE